MSDDIKERLLDESYKGQEAMRREALARIEALEAQLSALRASAVAEPVYQMMTIEDPDNNPGLWMDTQKDTFEKLRCLPDVRSRVLYTHPAPAAPVPASVREAFEDLADAVFDAGLSALVTEQWLAARRVLASLPAPEAAPTREEIIEQCAKIANSFNCGVCGMDGKAADAILALKSAPAK